MRRGRSRVTIRAIVSGSHSLSPSLYLRSDFDATVLLKTNVEWLQKGAATWKYWEHTTVAFMHFWAFFRENRGDLSSAILIPSSRASASGIRISVSGSHVFAFTWNLWFVFYLVFLVQGLRMKVKGNIQTKDVRYAHPRLHRGTLRNGPMLSILCSDFVESMTRDDAMLWCYWVTHPVNWLLQCFMLLLAAVVYICLSVLWHDRLWFWRTENEQKELPFRLHQ
jgi:hypothetical protein